MKDTIIKSVRLHRLEESLSFQGKIIEEQKFHPETGDRLTNCCGMYSTFCGDTFSLCCKGCFQEVPFGQGDGNEKLGDSIAEYHQKRVDGGAA
jgi:hypothetical protein